MSKKKKRDFFADRFLISVVLLLFLAGHFTVMTLLEAKDKLVIEALRQHEDEIAEAVDELEQVAEPDYASLEDAPPIPYADLDEQEIRRTRLT